MYGNMYADAYNHKYDNTYDNHYDNSRRLAATRPPTSPANQEAAYVRRLDAGVVIRSIESFRTPNLTASEASFEADGGLLRASWGRLGASFWGFLGVSETHFGAYTSFWPPKDPQRP